MRVPNRETEVVCCLYPLENEEIVWFVHEDGVFAGQGLQDPELFLSRSEYEKIESHPGLIQNFSPFLPDNQWHLLQWDYIEGRLEKTILFKKLPIHVQYFLLDQWKSYTF